MIIMVKICFNVEGQHLTRTCEDYLANESMAVLKLVATFNNEWDGFTKYALFGYKGEHYCSYPTLTNDGYEFIVPSEVLLGHGFYFTLVGYTSEDDEVITRLTTNQAYIRLNESGFTKNCKNGHFEEVDDEAIESLFTVFYSKAETDTLLSTYVMKDNGANTITDSSAYPNLQTRPNATQKTINKAINDKIGGCVPKMNGAEVMTDVTQYFNLETPFNSTQQTINNAIDTKIGEILERIAAIEDLIGEGE